MRQPGRNPSLESYVDLGLERDETSKARLVSKATISSARLHGLTRPATGAKTFGAYSNTHPVTVLIITMPRINRSGKHLEILTRSGKSTIDHRTMRNRRS
jgi:hypothetical protein